MTLISAVCVPLTTSNGTPRLPPSGLQQRLGKKRPQAYSTFGQAPKGACAALTNVTHTTTPVSVPKGSQKVSALFNISAPSATTSSERLCYWLKGYDPVNTE